MTSQSSDCQSSDCPQLMFESSQDIGLPGEDSQESTSAAVREPADEQPAGTHPTSAADGEPEAITMEKVKKLINLMKDMHLVLTSWKVPAADKYTRDILMARDNMEMEITCQLSVLETYMDNPERTVGAEVVETHIRKSQELKGQFDDLKEVFNKMARGLKRKASDEEGLEEKG